MSQSQISSMSLEAGLRSRTGLGEGIFIDLFAAVDDSTGGRRVFAVLLDDGALPISLESSAFERSTSSGISIVGFVGSFREKSLGAVMLVEV